MTKKGQAPASRRRGRPTKEESAQLKERLLDVASLQFRTHGYAATTIDMIAQQSKIGKMTIYRHYASKEQLFRAVVQRVNARFRNDFEKIEQGDRPVRDVLHDFILASYDDPASAEVLDITRTLIAEAKSFPDLAYEAYAQRREMHRPLSDYLRRMREEGKLHYSADPEMLSFQLVAVASGGIRTLMVPPEVIERGRDRWISAAFELFLKGTGKMDMDGKGNDGLDDRQVEERS